MNLRLKTRIALFNTVAAAISTLVVFCIIYGVVFMTTYRGLNELIHQERRDVFSQIHWNGDDIHVALIEEWEEKEHRQVEVNPIFLQLVDKSGNSIFKSLNLQEERLFFDTALVFNQYSDHQLKGQKIRQGQFPIYNPKGYVVAYLGIAVSREEAAFLLNNLALTLAIAFPVLVLFFYWAAALAAARSIAPLQQLILNVSDIDIEVGQRLPLPQHHDEIYQLAVAFNELLSKIEINLKREKQTTANISHELRTPIAAIRGNLEVLIRKPRQPEQYIQKIEQVIAQTIKAGDILDQLLNLARIESRQVNVQKTPVSPYLIIEQYIRQNQTAIQEKQIRLYNQIPSSLRIEADSRLFEVILANLLNNALKYSPAQGVIECQWHSPNLHISDQGPGIAPEHLPHIFEPFYRADASRDAQIPGTGLGLSIAKKLAELQGFELVAASVVGQGTTFMLKTS